jgi:glycosyltransferase involved in cell wall biosynthesis
MLAPFVVLRHLAPRGSRPILVLETHTLPTDNNAWIVKCCDLIVVNSETLAAEVGARFRISSARVLHAPLPPFNPVIRPTPKSDARAALGLDADAAIACYTGKMTRDHNEFLLEAARDAARRMERFRLLLVGGNPKILEWTRRRAAELGVDDTVILAGFVPPAKVGTYQAAADVLVYHMPETVGIFPYTTPAKGYEYQAMERPIVATDFPLFGEVFGKDGERAVRVVDRTPAGFADGIARAFALGESGREMTERAAAFVRERTWSNRSAAILDALNV